MKQSGQSTDTFTVVGRRGKKESPNTGRGLDWQVPRQLFYLTERCNLAALAGQTQGRTDVVSRSFHRSGTSARDSQSQVRYTCYLSIR